MHDIKRELKQATMTTATRAAPKKRFNEQNNSYTLSSASSTERGRRRLIFRTSIWN